MDNAHDLDVLCQKISKEIDAFVAEKLTYSWNQNITPKQAKDLAWEHILKYFGKAPPKPREEL